MADQIDFLNRLDSDHSDQGGVDLVAPERDPGGDFRIELAGRHVRLVPAVGWNHASICLGGGVHYREDRRTLIIPAGADRHDMSLRRSCVASPR